MAPKGASDARLCDVQKLAKVYTGDGRVCFEECPENSGGGDRRLHDAPEEWVDDALRIAARVRLPYDVYSYTKHAMLILSTEPDLPLWTRLINDLKLTFESFRFEVDIGVVSNATGLYAKCEQFFQRDFTNYGSVALAIVTTMAVNKSPNPQCDDSSLFFEESIVVENFKLDRNPTLVGKRKVYISEASRRSSSRPYHDILNLDPAVYGEVLGFHVPLPWPDDCNGYNLLGSYDSRPRPLRILCDKMAAMYNENNLPTIMEEAVKDAEKSFPLLKGIKIDVLNNLSKEFYFVIPCIEENQ